ncbi:MAG TPA: multiheme c-type cytochrome, partial [Nannocystaceae bacterium]|nr:multiheme c-type cytochrome [Nannocystaceae bacterium]
MDRRRSDAVINRRLSLAVLVLAACTSEEEGPPKRLLDAGECRECHPDHYQQWLGSMHAYAADDPMFLAMNARGQRETGGALGDFCVKCHAPVAVALGKTTDGLNLDEVPQELKGVTCYFCHNIATIDGLHDNPITLAMDDVLLGEYPDPVENEFHRADYSPATDGETLKSAQMCGSCHDIVNGHGVQLERTYDEWLASFYSDPDPANPELKVYYGNTCNGCHMPGSTGPIADYDGVKTRRFRDHRFVGVDLALTDFPDAEQGPALVADQRATMDEFRKPAVCAGLCVRPPEEGDGTDVVVWLHNEGAGHHWPSGATQDRRAWVQLEGFDGDTSVLQSGIVGAQDSIDAAAEADPTLLMLRDYAYGADGEHASMFWEVTDIDSQLLTVAKEAGLKYDKTTWAEQTWHVDGPVDRATMQVNLRPVPCER